MPLQGEFHIGIMRDLFDDGIFAVDGDKWGHQRKLASYEFSATVLRDFSTTAFRVNAAKLTSKILVSAAVEQMINLQIQYLRFLNIDLEATLKQNLMVIDDFIFKLIQWKREQMRNEKLDSGKDDLLSRFLMESVKDPENMTDQYITLNFLIAVKDTSANTLTWLFYMICKHTLAQEKISQEGWEATKAEESISADEFADSITEEALDKMQYLHAALTETITLSTSSSGKEFAYRQMKISAAVLLNFFKFKLVDEKKEATYRTMFTLQMDQGLHLYASPRLTMLVPTSKTLCLCKDIVERSFQDNDFVWYGQINSCAQQQGAGTF
ncbi:hypothetical protein FNV43_RR24189 [Rhamnella rubrinervis]|uniref:Cytochrome P450 n=1 Tax=Rhamnella rubrinervis TaxID=2594499 RepID=A0A8K0DXM7_9ROSA|nr:hypothetical protein FNV43_RR24189 [Rhamnella rubrinervis]